MGGETLRDLCYNLFCGTAGSTRSVHPEKADATKTEEKRKILRNNICCFCLTDHLIKWEGDFPRLTMGECVPVWFKELLVSAEGSGFWKVVFCCPSPLCSPFQGHSGAIWPAIVANRCFCFKDMHFHRLPDSAGTVSVFWLQVCSTNIKSIPSRYVALWSNFMFIYWCIVYWCFAFSFDEILEGNAGETHHYLPKFLIEIWMKSSFSAILFPRISSVHPLRRLWQAVRKGDWPATLWASGFHRKMPFFLKGFALLCVYVCLQKERVLFVAALYQKALLLTVDSSLQSG